MIEYNSLKKCTMNCDLLRQITFTLYIYVYSSTYKSFNDI